jgi:hypothetical protein
MKDFLIQFGVAIATFIVIMAYAIITLIKINIDDNKRKEKQK